MSEAWSMKCARSSASVQNVWSRPLYATVVHRKVQKNWLYETSYWKWS